MIHKYNNIYLGMKEHVASDIDTRSVAVFTQTLYHEEPLKVHVQELMPC